MKASVKSVSLVLIFLISGLFLLNFSLSGQDNPPVFAGLPDNINKIVSVSCVPCHTSTGGLLSRSKLNFTEWTNYSVKKQKEKAEKMYSMLHKNAMPPKSVRDNRPDIIPTKEQTETIQKWADSLSGDKK